jgi:hypothetical protein
MDTLWLSSGSSSNIVNVFIRDLSDNNGLGKTAMTFETATITASYTRPGAAPVAITLVTQTPTGAYSSGGFCLYDDTTAPGLYRLDVPNAAFNAGVAYVDVCIQGVADASPVSLRIMLTPNVNVSTITNDAITAASIATDAITDDAIGTGAIAATAFAAGAIDAAAIANGAIDAATFAAGAIDASAIAVGAIAADAFAAGAIDAAAIAANAIGASELAADAVAEIWAYACTEPTAVVGAAPTAIAALSWLNTLSRNKMTVTATTQIIKADDGTTTVATSTISDDGTTFTRGEFA